ncbi:hypothetical protein LAZ67_X002443 [Cordylochernes scorpioides]|uniref:Uncharacterized protein n=1 Tax=Cordylochernes scorpioides TaxID=51811 RepID=A0ABY6LTF1_9ARAC|nr:hypothetical protein LAZ67_X002443 [Cordylochernes scorpioides]
MTYRSLCFLPYSPSSVDIARKLKSYGIRTIYKNSPNLLSSLRHPHTKSSAPPDPLRSMGAVYSVSCEQCSATYVGETGVLGTLYVFPRYTAERDRACTGG